MEGILTGADKGAVSFVVGQGSGSGALTGSGTFVPGGGVGGGKCQMGGMRQGKGNDRRASARTMRPSSIVGGANQGRSRRPVRGQGARIVLGRVAVGRIG